MKKYQKRGMTELILVAITLVLVFAITFISSTEPTGMMTAIEGAWFGVNDPQYINGSALISNTNGSSLTYRFNGSKLFVVTQERDDFGIMDVIVDGVTFDYDLYNEEMQYNAVKEIPAFGGWEHEAIIKVTGRKNNESLGTYILIDELLIDNLTMPREIAPLPELPINVTMQLPAEINKPVIWKKIVNVSDELVIELPTSENITVKKIVGGIKEDIPEKDIQKLQDKDNDTVLIQTKIIESENITIFVNDSALYEITYQTKPPQITETNLSTTQKEITVYSDLHYENITTYATLPVESPQTAITLYHIVNDTKILFTNNISYLDENENGLVDKIQWVVPHLSNQTFLIEITILNVFSFPRQGENWTISFNTTGTANLTVTPVNDTQWDREISFTELKCWGEKVDALYNNSTVFKENYACNTTGTFTSLVHIPGTAVLEFRFGNNVAYAYDPHSGGLHNVTSELDVNWSRIVTDNAPQGIARWGATGIDVTPSQMLVYDIVYRVSILYGELDRTKTTTTLAVTNNTWQYNSTTQNWTIGSYSTSPGNVRSPAMAYDSINNVTVLFGGVENATSSSTINVLSETWILNLTSNTWTNATPSTRPTIINDDATDKGAYSIAFDKANGSVILFGGTGKNGGNETWMYRVDTNTWRLLGVDATNRPATRSIQSMAYDESANLTVIFGGTVIGGFSGAGNGNETWVFNATDSTWKQRAIPDAIGSTGNLGRGMTYDSDQKMLIIVYRNLNTTLGYNTTSNTWFNLTSRLLANSESVSAAITYDRIASATINFGAAQVSPGNAVNQTWYFNITPLGGGAGDTAPPAWSNNATNFTKIPQNGTGIFNATWTDNVELSGFIFSINESGSFINSTFQRFSGTTNISTNRTIITANASAKIGWRFYANDTSNNWNSTAIFTFIVNSPPVGSIPDQTFQGGAGTINLANFITDADGDTLSFTVTTTTLSSSLSGSTATFSGTGTETATVTASDGIETFTTQVKITVIPESSSPFFGGGFGGGEGKKGGEGEGEGGEGEGEVGQAAVAAAPAVVAVQPVPAIAAISVIGAPGGLNLSQIVKLQQLKVDASNFTKFRALLGVEPLVNFTEMTLDMGYVCAGPRYKIFKCENWNFTEGYCNNDTQWLTFMHLSQGLHQINITLKPKDPGLGIGPSPYASYCGDNTCDEGETCKNCDFDCGKCPIAVGVTGGAITGKVTACQENWICDEWSYYNASGQRTRVCRDINNCDTTASRPITEEACEYMEIQPRIVEVRPIIMKRLPLTTIAYSLAVIILLAALATGGYFSYIHQRKKRETVVMYEPRVTKEQLIQEILTGKDTETICKQYALDKQQINAFAHAVKNTIAAATDYCMQALLQGKNIDALKREMLYAGWPERVLQEVISSATVYTDKLGTFIKKAIKKGYSENRIQETLQQKGWNQILVAQYLKPYIGAQEAVRQRIKEGLERGYPIEQITSVFVEIGWDEKYIEQIAMIEKEQIRERENEKIWEKVLEDLRKNRKIDESKNRWINKNMRELIIGTGRISVERRMMAEHLPIKIIPNALEVCDQKVKLLQEEIKQRINTGEPIKIIEDELITNWGKEAAHELLRTHEQEINAIKRRIAVYRTEGFIDQDIAHILITEGYARGLVLALVKGR